MKTRSIAGTILTKTALLIKDKEFRVLTFVKKILSRIRNFHNCHLKKQLKKFKRKKKFVNRKKIQWVSLCLQGS
jgi:hypothetical protein